jgi:sugar (pentulose or hexulose) kinase
MQDDPSACVSVYHTQAPSHDFAEQDAAAWLRFGLDVVAARLQGLSKHLVEVASRSGGRGRATRSGRFPTW